MGLPQSKHEESLMELNRRLAEGHAEFQYTAPHNVEVSFADYGDIANDPILAVRNGMRRNFTMTSYSLGPEHIYYSRGFKMLFEVRDVQGPYRENFANWAKNKGCFLSLKIAPNIEHIKGLRNYLRDIFGQPFDHVQSIGQKKWLEDGMIFNNTLEEIIEKEIVTDLPEWYGVW